MAITRSQIARQLLAEGGAPNPRKPFQMGGFGDTGFATETMSDFSTDVGGTADPSSFGDTGDLGSEQANVAANLSAMQASGVGQGENFPGVLGVINRGLTNFRNRTNLARRTSFLDRVGYGNQFNPEFIQSPLGLQTLKNMGYTTIEDVIAAQRGESESKIVKPMIPRLPTDIEPEKSDMAEAEFVQRFTLPERFRLRAGGSPGNTTLQRVLPRMDGRRPGYYGADAGFGDDDYKDESASFDAGSGSGGSDADFAAARAAIMGPSTYTDDRGNTIDVSGLQKQGYGRLGIANLLGPLAQQYGIGVNAPSIGVLGPLGSIDTDTNKDKDKDEGAKNNLDDLRQSALDIGRDISDPGSLFGQALTAGQAAVAKEQSLRDRFDIGRADGGSIRQAYGLGSIVKKVTGAVKKVVKSPVGKAALAVGLAGAPFGGGSFFGSGSLYGKAIPFAQEFLGKEMFKNYFIKDGGGLTGRGLATLGIGGASLLAGAMTPKEDEQESLSERIADRTGLDIAAIRKEVQDAYASGNTASLRNKYPFLITESAAAAEGGRIGFAEGTQGDEIIEEKELPRLRNMPEFKGDEVKPADMMMAGYGYNEAMSDTYDSYLDMKKKGLIPPTMDFDEFLQEVVPEMSKKQGIERTMVAEGGMMDLGGNEMDLRGGGFVPLGVAEKADDVPARLSKNEFVFTADAVRAAGGGSVDKGADLMYKTMKQLENKVA